MILSRLPTRYRAVAIMAAAAAIGGGFVGSSRLPASEAGEAKLAGAGASQVANSYRVDTIELPDGIDSEVAALTFNEEGEFIVVTRYHGILVGTPASDGPLPSFSWRIFCDQILDDPVGVLAEPGGTLLVAQRHELTRLHDTDDDGLADYFEAIVATQAPISSGTQPDGDGNWLLALAIGKGRARWQGWTTTVSPDGSLTPLCSGINHSGGIATSRDGSFFATDRAGEWNSEHALRMLEKDLFHGDPAALLWDQEFVKLHPDPLAWAKSNADDLANKTVAPALRIPAGDFCAAPGELVFHLGESDSFGPFSGQCFVADSGSSECRLLRLMLELVEGKWQGSIARFSVEGLSGGNAHRLCFSPDGTQLYIGQTRTGESDEAPKLQRITAVPGDRSFALRSISTLPSSLQLRFTDEMDRSLAVDPTRYAVERHPSDGSAPSSAFPRRAIVSPDGQTLNLFFDAVTLAPNFRYSIDLAKLPSHSGKKITDAVAHHTIHRIPSDLAATIPHPKPRSETGDNKTEPVE